MKYWTNIDNKRAIEWKLSLQEAYLFDWMYSLQSGADKITINGVDYFFASKSEAIKEMPILTNKVDTMYRYYKGLETKDLIIIKKVGGKDYISLTDKAKIWGRKSEYNSENNPTYNNIL